MTAHTFGPSTFGTHTVCQTCGLLPIDIDDRDTDCTPVYEQTRITVEICVDCLYCLANGAPEDWTEEQQNEWSDKVAANWDDSLVTLGCDCCQDETEPWFSWSDCELCGSTLGGDRVHATVWYVSKVGETR